MDIPTIYKHNYAKKKRINLSVDPLLNCCLLLLLYNDLKAGSGSGTLLSA